MLSTFSTNASSNDKGKKQKCWYFTESRASPRFPAACSFVNANRGMIHVGIGSNVVRRAMMEIVLVEPPTVAKSEQEI